VPESSKPAEIEASRNILKTTEFYTLNGWMGWYAKKICMWCRYRYISVKLFKKEKRTGKTFSHVIHKIKNKEYPQKMKKIPSFHKILSFFPPMYWTQGLYQFFFEKVFFNIESLKLFARAVFDPWSSWSLPSE
jgi:hypothetical protein